MKQEVLSEFSFSRMNTADEIVDAANIIASCIEILASGVEK